MPNMEVIVPADNQQASLALEYALSRQNPVYIRMCRNAMPDLSVNTAVSGNALAKAFSSCEPIKLKNGYGVTIAANGVTASMCLEAADILAKDGIDAEVLSVPFVKPCGGKGLAESVKKTGCLVTVEEHTVVGGFGSACLEKLCGEGVSFTYKAIGIEDTFAETGPYNELLAAYGLSAKAIAAKVKKLTAR
jgi:transketolase